MRKTCIKQATRISQQGHGNLSINWKNGFLEELKTELGPLLQLFLSLSSTPQTPGDLLGLKNSEASLQDTRSEMLRITSAKPNVSFATDTTAGDDGNSKGRSLWFNACATTKATAPTTKPTTMNDSMNKNSIGFQARLNALE